MKASFMSVMKTHRLDLYGHSVPPSALPQK